MFETEVKAGVAWLDETHPGWELKIDLSQLDMSHSCLCILGQLEGNYWTALHDHKLEYDEGEEMGFAVTGERNMAGWRVTDAVTWGLLTAEWHEAIKDRLDKGIEL
jgi:hypothetical protein